MVVCDVLVEIFKDDIRFIFGKFVDAFREDTISHKIAESILSVDEQSLPPGYRISPDDGMRCGQIIADR